MERGSLGSPKFDGPRRDFPHAQRVQKVVKVGRAGFHDQDAITLNSKKLWLPSQPLELEDARASSQRPPPFNYRSVYPVNQPQLKFSAS